MNSFALLRTNVGLTTNIKIMVDSNYNLTLDSIDSTADLSISKLKKVSFTKKNYYDELIKFFFEGIPADTAYSIKYDEDVSIMTSEFSNQYDEIYQYGARNITNNKNYLEEFEYFAPLHISKGKLPKFFIIFRVDGPGLININKNNFKSQILQNLKVVKIFDLTKKTALGEWLDLNFSKDSQFFPDTAVEIDFRTLEFCKWVGINFESGGYISNSLFIDDIIDEEKEIFELEKFVFDKFKDSKVVYPNILNMSFLFDDEPSTPEVKRKWSINRYCGFYLEDIELVTTLSPYITPFLKTDVQILDQNILYSPTSTDPFVEGWSDNKIFYIEYNGNYYKIEKISQSRGINLVESSTKSRGVTRGTPRGSSEQYAETFSTQYKIISDINLKGKESEINKNFGYINSSSILEDYNNNPLVISEFDNADVWLIEIDGVYHKLSKSARNQIKINSDYSFSYGENKYQYTVAGKTTTVSTLVNVNTPPKKWSIYRLKFTDIKDFDDRIIDTEFSKFEYEKKEDLTISDENKMYFTNLNSQSNPPALDDFVYKGQVVNIPVSSEYTANQETFKVRQNELTQLWRKNPIHCRWSFENSLSANDYPYLLNNSELMEDFNRTVNTYESYPKIIERNLDYFYTINSSTVSYTHHSLHINGYTSSNQIDATFRFELDKYLGVATYSVGSVSATYSFDYFSHIFDRKVVFDDGDIIKNVKKYSVFNQGDKVIPNLTLFRGIKFILYDVNSIEKSDLGELNINLKNSNSYKDYKFSILLSDNDLSVNNNGLVIQSANQMNWTIIDEWKMDTTYPVGSIGIFDDILYESSAETTIVLPSTIRGSSQVKNSPHSTVEWVPYSLYNSIFWNPNKVYDQNSSSFYDYIVYNSGEYYYYNNIGTEDFWNPTISSGVGYSLGEVVLFRNQYWMSMTSSNYVTPDFQQEIRVSSEWQKLWVATQSTSPKWSPIKLWNPSRTYNTTTLESSLVVHNEIVWISSVESSLITAGEEPAISNKWERLYSLVPDTDLVYTPSFNPIIHMNNRYYLINSNSNNSTLDNGIIIYVNKKWKNVLVNINIADNTVDNISNSDRHSLYSDLNKKLTANNFILAINDIRNKYGFTDYVTYVIIDEFGNIKKYKYDLNISSLPCMLVCETPEELDIKAQSLVKLPVQLTGDLISKKVLNDGLIKDLSYLNYYNNTSVASNIIENKFQPKVVENYHGNKNILKNRIYRFTGNYVPLFYDIDLFEKNWEKSAVGNYKFDTTLTSFGIMKERRISKVNRKGNILKLKDSKDNKSIYPMLDEFGYTTDDFFIFSSTWDPSYHVETFINDELPIVTFQIQTAQTSLINLESTLGGIGQVNIESQSDQDIDENTSEL
jgi:hypothetical protein